MITKVYIRNFKGIKKCEINDLKKVNLFIGRNDSCKSTILEVMYSTLKELESPSLGNILLRRSNVRIGGRELWYDYKTNRTILIQLEFGSGTISMMVDHHPDTDEIISQLEVHTRVKTKESSIRGPSSVYRGRDWSFRSSSKTQNFLDPFPVTEKPLVQSYVTNSALLDSSSRNDLKLIENLLGDIKLQLKTEEFGKYLFGAFGKGKKWEFLPHPDLIGEFRLAIKEGKKSLFLSALGDGIRFGMYIIAKSLLVNNTALFVEEIESNQHPESLKKLIHHLIDISQKNRLQVFVTTHERTVWGLFETEFPKPAQRNKDFQCFHVTRDNNTGIVNCSPLTKQNANDFWMNVDKDLWGSP